MHVIATAGHVDHGKSTLVHRLTGVDPDRLAEEKERGLTIDLGFAHCTLPSGSEVGFVDVPGHVRFLKNMLAGVGGIDACLFVVSATEGWMPQSEEHLAILGLLGIRHGMVALTRSASVDGDRRAAVRQAVAERLSGTFLEGCEIVAVDAPAGVGVEGPGGLVEALEHLVESAPTALDVGRPRLWVDRSFAVRGSGTVVTGLLTGGSVAVGQHLAVLPGGHEVRVRGLQSHGQPLEVAGPGRRLAMNLHGVGHEQVGRGDAVVSGAQWHRAVTVDATLEVLATVEHGVSSRGAYLAYLGSGEYPVRLRLVGGRTSIEPGATGAVRLWLPVPLPLVPGDRYVLRESGRSETIGGGEVLDVAPIRPPARATPDRSVDRVVAERGWTDVDELARLTGTRRPATVGSWVVSEAALVETQASVRHLVGQADALGLPLAALDTRQRAVVPLLGDLVVTDGRLRPAGEGSARLDAVLDVHPFLAALAATPFAPPPPDGVDRGELRALERRGLVVEANGMWFAASAVDDAARVVADLLAGSPDGVTAGEIRAALGTSRKYALPLLAYLDGNGITRRRGDLRIAGPRLPAGSGSAATVGATAGGPRRGEVR